MRDLGPALARRAAAEAGFDEEDRPAGASALVVARRRGVERDLRHPLDRRPQLVVEIRTNSPSTRCRSREQQPPWTPRSAASGTAPPPPSPRRARRASTSARTDPRPGCRRRSLETIGPTRIFWPACFATCTLRAQLPARRGAVRLAADHVGRRGVCRHGGDRDDDVAERMVGLQPANRFRHAGGV